MDFWSLGESKFLLLSSADLALGRLTCCLVIVFVGEACVDLECSEDD